MQGSGSWPLADGAVTFGYMYLAVGKCGVLPKSYQSSLVPRRTFTCSTEKRL